MTRRMFRNQLLMLCLASQLSGAAVTAQDFKRTDLFGNPAPSRPVLRSGTVMSESSRTTVRNVSTGSTNSAQTTIAGQSAARAATPQEQLNQLCTEAIKITSRRYLSSEVHTPWQILHGLLALRGDYQIKVNGQKSSALDWLTNASSYQGLPMVEHTAYGGRFHPFTTPYAFEGHPNQFLAIVTMSDLPATYAFKTTSGGQVTISDMLKNAQMDVNDREEITWTLWSMSRYLPIDSEWLNKYNEPWSIERLVQIQTYAEVNEAACGGTHGLFALSLARNAAQATGRPLRGIWIEADQKVRRYISTARSLQNADGTFSSNYFASPGYSTEFGKRIATSGHILEFLMVGASNSDLDQEWLQNGIRAVATDLIEHRKEAADCGPLYHALHALVLYQQRTGYVEPTEPASGETPATVAAEPVSEPSGAISGSGDLDEVTPALDKPETPNPRVAIPDERPADTQPELKSVPVSPPPSGPVPKRIATEPNAGQERAAGPSLALPEAGFTSTISMPGSRTAAKPAGTAIAAAPNSVAQPLPTLDQPTEPGLLSVDDPLLPRVAIETTDPIGLLDLPDVSAAPLATAAKIDGVAKIDGAAPAKKFRSPEDNAPVVRSEPLVMEDGYEVPLPPTED